MMIDLSRVWPELKAVEKIGEGSFGKVYKCEREEYGIKSVCDTHFVAVGGNGVAVAKGDNEFGECNLDEWTDIKSPD